MQGASPFRSFFMSGFECSAHRRRDGRRLDLLASTGHDRLAEADYRQVRELGLKTVRDGLRWHLIETSSGVYDWSSFLPMLRAALSADVQVIWDICHYGWPDDLDIWSPDFVDRLARFAGAAAQLVREQTDAIPIYCPVNEISFWSWAGGEMARMNPNTRRRGAELKRQLVRGSLAAIDAIRDVEPRARFMHAEPVIHVTTYSTRQRARAEAYRLSQFEALDMLAGRLEPELGGHLRYLDLIGVNFYPQNQWLYSGCTIPFGHHAFRPLRNMLLEVYERYGRPLVVSETGAEGGARPSWLHYVGAEVSAARARGLPLFGICLYPILDYDGWDNGRRCDVGLLGVADENGARTVFTPLLEELERQQLVIETASDLCSLVHADSPGKSSDEE